jgi:hypothetical protein
MREDEMHIDCYTKVVLTLIAGALLLIAAENLLGPARAQSGSGVTKVAICNINGSVCASVNERWDGAPRLMTWDQHR